MLTSFQITEALYPSVDYAQERLRALTQRLGVVGRFRPQKPDGGSYQYRYVLAQVGVEVVAAQRGDAPPHRDQARRRRWHLTRRANLPHLLGVNGFFTALAGHARTHPGSALARWFAGGTLPADGGLRRARRRRHRADLRAEVTAGRARHLDRRRPQVPFFLEYDLGTERPLSRLVDKIDGYRELAHITGRIWPVMFWLHSLARERRLHQELAAAGTIYPGGHRRARRRHRHQPAEAGGVAAPPPRAPLCLADLPAAASRTEQAT